MKRIMMAAAAVALAAIGARAADTPAAGAAQVVIGGVGINVADIPKAIKFYTEVLGLKLALQVPAKGETKEAVLTNDGKLAAPMIVLAKIGAEMKPGRETFGRVITNAPSAQIKEIAARAAAAGYKVSKVGGDASHAVFITDADGYGVEVFPNDMPPPVGK